MTKTRLTRVETWVNQGIPDCIAAKGGKFALIELKVASLSGKVALSPHQVSFHSAHADYPCFIVVKTNDGRASKVLVYKASQAMQLLEQGTKLEPALSAPISEWEPIENFIFQS